MKVHGQIIIKNSKENIWRAVTDIQSAAQVFKDIKSIEILEKPEQGFLGTRWKETREFMGKEATETMWITEVSDLQSYTSKAENSGCIYHSTIILEESGDGVTVTKTFESTPVTWFAKLMAPLMILMGGTLKKCLMKDLDDLKSYIEGQGSEK